MKDKAANIVDKSLEPFLNKMERRILRLNGLAIPEKTRLLIENRIWQMEEKISEANELLSELRKTQQSAAAFLKDSRTNLSKASLETISEEILRALPEALLPELLPLLEKSFEGRLAEYSKKLDGCLKVTLKDGRRLAIRTAAITDITVDERFSGNVGDRWRAGLPEMVVSYCGSDEKKLHVVFTVEGYRNADALEWFGELQNKLMNHISVSIDPGDGCLAFFK